MFCNTLYSVMLANWFMPTPVKLFAIERSEPLLGPAPKSIPLLKQDGYELLGQLIELS